MAAIYCYTNLTNGKKYIGQSTDPEQRKRAHKSSAFNPNDSEYNSVFHQAVREFGLDNFEYTILQETDDLELLDSLEKFYIQYYNSIVPNGYNVLEGGKHAPQKKKTIEEKIALTWHKAKLTEEEIKELRIAYANNESPSKIYEEKYKDRLTKSSFMNIWSGRRYGNIMPEYLKKGRHTKLTEETVRNIRLDYQNHLGTYESLAQKYGISKATVADIIKYRTWKNVKI